MDNSISKTIKTALATRMQQIQRNAVLLGFAALLAVTAWFVLVACIVILLTPYWGPAWAALAVGLGALILAAIIVAIVSALSRADRRRAKETGTLQKAGLLAALALVTRKTPSAAKPAATRQPTKTFFAAAAGMALAGVISALLNTRKDR